MSSRLKLIVSYDGAGFAGWQSQPNHNAIQDHLEAAFHQIVSKPIRVHGAGRTDAGVHAFAQCAHVDLPERRYDSKRWVLALNGVLPATIRVLRCRFVSTEFHARFSAKEKTYRYRIWNDTVLPPFELGRAWHVVNALDFEQIVRSAKDFKGKRDFLSFSANRGKPETTTVRTIRAVRVRRSGPCIVVEFNGDGFLYKMVRMMVGALVGVGLGKCSAQDVRTRLKTPRRLISSGQTCAPAAGLFLVRIRY